MTANNDPSSPTDQPLAAGFDAASLERWRALVDKTLKGADFDRRLVSRTTDGIPVGPLYTRADQLPALASGRPGEPPYTRGTSLGSSRHITRNRPLHAQTDPPALRLAIAEDIAAGVESLSIRIAAPGQSGLAASQPAIEAALTGIPLERVRIALSAGSYAIEAATTLIAHAKARGAPQAVSALGIDPLGTLARTGELVLLKADRTGFAHALPWLPSPGTTLLADARPYHNAGASEAQELAALAATLVAYLRACQTAGLAPADALPRIALALALDADIVLGAAKLRAARRIVWRIADACGAGPFAAQMALDVTTSERIMTRRDPWVNMLRVTAACAAAMIGGASAITVLPFSWPLGQPDAFARRIARNVAIVLAEESSLDRIVDPAGGAFAVEALTDELARKAWTIFQSWEAAGGMQAALVAGLVQDQIADVAAERSRALATGKLALTGTSTFPRLGDDGVTVDPWPPTPAVPSSPAARPLAIHRLAEPFERLRDAADAASPRPTVFLAALGPPAEHGARSTWLENVLAAGGIGIARAPDSEQAITSSADAGRAFAASGASIACICANDQTYSELGEATAMALKAAGATHVLLAGHPTAQAAALKAAGVDTFLMAGCDVIATLTSILHQFGIVVR